MKVDKERIADIIGDTRLDISGRVDENNLKRAEAVLDYLEEVRTGSARERMEQATPDVYRGSTRIDAAAAVISILDYPTYEPDWQFARRVALAMDDADAKLGIRRYTEREFVQAVEKKAYEYHEGACAYKDALERAARDQSDTDKEP